MTKPKRNNDKYWTGTNKFDEIEYADDLEEYISELEVKLSGQPEPLDCLVSLPANIKLNPSGQRKLLDWIKFCFEIGWSKEHVIKLKDFWLETHDEYGNLI